MNPQIDINQLAAEMKAKPRRRSNQFWTPFAWAVRALVERGYGVRESARAVLARSGEEVTEEATACVRVTYYRIRKQMWPPEMAHLRGKVAPPTLEESPERLPWGSLSRAQGEDDFEV